MRTPSVLTIILLCLAPLTGITQAVGMPPTPVIVTVTAMEDYADELEALGTLNSQENVNLTSAVTEIVTKVSFTDNQRVKKGDVLVEMDIAEELAELAEQKAIAAEASRQVKRFSPLVNKSAASESVLGANQRDLESAEARINAIQARINQRILKAPFDGVLGLRNISAGALVQPGALITTIDDDSVMRLDFSVPELFLSSLKPGVIVKAQSDAFPNTVFSGEIAFIDSRIDPITRSIRVRALIQNDAKMLKPGLLMRVQLRKNPRRALLILEEAITSNGPNNFVFVVNTDQQPAVVEKRAIQVGTRTYGKAEITSGLSEGETIVSHGILRLRPGAPVTITATEKNGESLEQLLGEKPAENDLSEQADK